MWAGEDGEGEATVDGDGHEGGKTRGRPQWQRGAKWAQGRRRPRNFFAKR